MEKQSMPLARVGTKHQVVIPKAVFSKLGLAPGDYVEVSLRKNQAVITRKKFVDDFPTTDEAIGPKTRASIRQGLKELKAGKGRGPFKNAKDLISDLHRRVRSAK
jgi:AbrB family looped-hinge helix DNA binding protein